MQKTCKNPKCGILFEGANRDEYCVDCYWIKRREDLKKARFKYEKTHQDRQLGGERWDKSIMEFLRKKREKKDKYYDDIYTK